MRRPGLRFAVAIAILVLGGCGGTPPVPEPPPPDPPPPAGCAASTLLPPAKLTILAEAPPLNGVELNQAAGELAARFSTSLRRWHDLAKAAPPDCAAPGPLLTYQQASFATDQPEQCLAVAERCLPPSGPLSDGQSLLALYAGLCADRRHQLEAARAYFRRATAKENESCPDQEGRIFVYAAFARSTQYAADAEDLLRSRLGLSPAEVQVAEGALDFLAGRRSLAEPNAAIEAFLTRRLGDGGRTWQAVIYPRWLLALALGVQRSETALANILSNPPLLVDLMPNQGTIAQTLYQAFFISSADQGPLLAEKIYLEYSPRARAASYLPLEDNAHSYGQLRWTVCKSALLDVEGQAALAAISGSWRKGEKSAAEALQQAAALQASQGEKADLLTFIGYLHQRTGRRDEAESFYLRAHRACPFYNRAHWGLAVLSRSRRVEAYSDFAQRQAELAAAAEQLVPPALLDQYLQIDPSITPAERKLYLSAVGLWLPYLPALAGAKNQAHLKHGYQVLSELEGLEYLRDQRVEYAGDYRLYDDLRGIGGTTVAADVDATLQSLHAADTNILFHEVAHQLQVAAPASFQACIKKLYEEAKTRQGFTTYYAARNEMEYFAVGSECFVIPENAPLRYGSNRGWLKQFDPKLFNVLEQLERKTELSTIQCP